MAYDFRQLSPHDFERLVRDLLSEYFGVRFESFAEGVDGGIDLRVLRSAGTQDIVQCKHYANSTVSVLLSHLKRNELPKLTRLQPARYGVATSLGLTPKNKQAIVQLLTPNVPDTSWVWGRDDLDGLITGYPAVARRHFKLWLASTEMLDAVTNADALNQTDGYLTRIATEARLYVHTKAYPKARHRLSKHHVCIISGPPGIGKSTLANMLILDHLRRVFQPVIVSSDITTAWRLLRPEVPQFFFYDDFLGTNTLASLEKNEDDRLLELIRLISRTENKRLVLCTREYILREAKLRSEKWRFGDTDLYKFLLKPTDFTRWQRGLILYNHVYFSALTMAARESLLNESRYVKIVDHPNYSPRLVNHLVTMAQLNNADNQHFADFAMVTLEDPERLWIHAFENDLDSDSRSLLLALTSLPNVVSLRTLLRAASPLGGRIFDDHVAVSRMLRRLEGTFIELTGGPTDPDIRFHDPSVRDFLLGYMAKNPPELGRVLESAILFVQVERIREFAGQSNRGLVWPARPDRRAPLTSALKSTEIQCLNAMKRTAINDDSEDGSSYAPPYEERLLITLAEMERLGRHDNAWVSRACSFIAEHWSRGDYNLDGVRELARNISQTPPQVQQWFAEQLDLLEHELVSTSDSVYDFDALVEIFGADSQVLERIGVAFLEYVDENIHSYAFRGSASVAIDVANALGLGDDERMIRASELSALSDRDEDDRESEDWSMDEKEAPRRRTSDDVLLQTLFGTLREPTR